MMEILQKLWFMHIILVAMFIMIVYNIYHFEDPKDWI